MKNADSLQLPTNNTSNDSCVIGAKVTSCADVRYLVDNGENIGRRFYVQEQAFSSLATHSSKAAFLIYTMIAQVSVIKAVYHYVQEDGVFWGHITPERAEGIMKVVTEEWLPKVTKTLKYIGYRPADNRLRSHLFALLNENESICATCYFSNYYTFATGLFSANQMYSDTTAIADIKLKLPTQENLTLISGLRLTLIEPDYEIGEDKARYYSKSFHPSNTISASAVIDTKCAVRQTINLELTELINSYFPVPNENEQRIISNILNAVLSAFSRGILKIDELSKIR